jgi:hypothetical protein
LAPLVAALRAGTQGGRRAERADDRRQLDPVEDPAGGPNFYRLDDRAAYYLNVDNTGDGRFDVRYRFKFKTRVIDKNSFLYALPGVSSIRDPKLNVQQTYSAVRETFRNGRESTHTVLGTNLPVAPNDVGPKTFPNYAPSRARPSAICVGVDRGDLPHGAGGPMQASDVEAVDADELAGTRAIDVQWRCSVL